MAQLISYKDRQKLSKETKSENAKAIMYVIELTPVPVTKSYESAQQNIVEDARAVRDSFYDQMEVDIINSTGVSYSICLARQETSRTASLIVRGQEISNICKDKGGGYDYKNLYDGRVKGGSKYRMRSKSAMIVDSEFYKSLSPVSKCIAKASALCAYLKGREDGASNGADVLWAFLCRMWGVTQDEDVPTLGIMYNPEASTKRIGRVFSHVNHQVLPFPNTQDYVHVDMSALQRYADAYHTHIDCISYANCAKILYLIEQATSKEPIGELYFAFL